MFLRSVRIGGVTFCTFSTYCYTFFYIDTNHCDLGSAGCNMTTSTCEVLRDGTYICICNPDSQHICYTDGDVCANGNNTCNNKTTDCLHLFNNTARYVCKCKQGYEKENLDSCKNIKKEPIIELMRSPRKFARVSLLYLICG